MDYWESGIYDETQLPAGASPDFIAVDRLKAKYAAADAAINASLAEGFQSVYEGAKYATDVLRYEIEKPVAVGVGTAEDAGICARVRLRIDQRAVISRTAFEAALELQNSGSSPIENLFVNIEVRDVTGQDATSLFSISPPVLNVIDSVDGTGTLPAGQTGTAAWTILPTDDAAPDAARVYSVGGTLSYTLDGVQIDIPLFPASITVLPNPSLHLKYFWHSGRGMSSAMTRSRPTSSRRSRSASGSSCGIPGQVRRATYASPPASLRSSRTKRDF